MLGIGACRPKRLVSNNEVCEVLDSSDQWIFERSGIRNRRWISGDESARSMAAAAAERAAQGKTSGTVRVEDEGVVIVADLPKKVSWDQDRLAAMAERIRAAGDDPTEYLEIAYRVPERRFGAWPAAMREGFADARSETTGKPVYRLETRDR